MALQVAGLSLSKLAEAPCQAICQCMPVFFFPPCRRKFRSQTFDNMDRWKRRGGKSQRRERQKKQAQRRERARRKKMQAREKVEKSRNTVFFQCVGASKSRLAKAPGAEPSGQMGDEKLHAVVARTAFRSQKC